MEWVKIVVPLIAVAVWILANLARVPREQPRSPVRKPPLPPKDSDQPPSPSRPGTSGVDRFLEEVARRRREAAERRRAGPADRSPAPPEERRSESPAPVRPATPPVVIPVARRAPRSRPAVEPRPRSRAAEPPRAVPELIPARARPVVVEVVEVQPLAPPPVPALVAATAFPSTTVARPTPRVASQTLALLHDPRSLSLALVLHEILEPPLCRRYSRRGR
jgi:hypothetical protein